MIGFWALLSCTGSFARARETVRSNVMGSKKSAARHSIRQRKPKHIVSQVALEAFHPEHAIRCRVSFELTSHNTPNVDGPLRGGSVIVFGQFKIFDNKTMPRTGSFKGVPFFRREFVITL
uniref:Uncharacterized protein n=1 Tax=Cupriavidus pinatubonensis (strain JMP 134 / LMG 1197) TaxID=264198 RepID=Q472N0_CUPPJ